MGMRLEDKAAGKQNFSRFLNEQAMKGPDIDAKGSANADEPIAYAVKAISASVYDYA